MGRGHTHNGYPAYLANSLAVRLRRAISACSCLFPILTACALNTKNILLGTGITSVFVRTAPTIAMAAASVDHFSGGRFLLGLGTSHKVQVEPEHGLVFEKPVPRLR